MATERDPIDAADSLLAYFEEESDVAYAEVGAVRRRQGRATLATERTRAPEPIEVTSVWCRAFVGGAAGYRYTSVLDDDNLRDVADRVIRSAQVLAQDQPSKFDPATLHRAAHGGWNAGNRSFDVDGVLDRLRELSEPIEAVDHDRFRLSYNRDLLDLSLLTTTGSTVQTTLDRASVMTAISPTDGPQLSTHVGTTTGDEVLDRVPPAIDAQLESVTRFSEMEIATTAPSGRREVAFSPHATGQLVHHLSHYFEMDTIYSGAAPFERGERIAPEGISIHDTVQPGSWAAMAYDAEARPAHPVTLVNNGVVRSFLHNIETAIEEGVEPCGNVVFPTGFEHPPRIHARHLTVDPGTESNAELRDGAELWIDRLDRPVLKNEVTSAKRTTGTPPSTLYAHNARKHTPDKYDECEQRLRFGVEEGYLLDGERRAERLDGVSIEFDVRDLMSITGIGDARTSVTGICNKHRSTLPFAVTAPGIRLETTINE